MKALRNEGSLLIPLNPPRAERDKRREILQVVEEGKINNLQNDNYKGLFYADN
jgi:hypothetical protein